MAAVEVRWELVSEAPDEKFGYVKLGIGVYRTRVAGGWLVTMSHPTEGGAGRPKVEGITFVPDPTGRWNLYDT